MLKKYFTAFLICLFIIFLVIFSKSSMNAASTALETCFNVLLPSLFPFFVMSRLLILSGSANIIGKIFCPVVKTLFGTNQNGAIPFVLGVLSGYPVGAQCVCELYDKKQLSKSEAENLLCFCNNSGPLFVISAVGIGLFYSREIGVMLYLVHIVSAIIVGMILKKFSSPTIKHAKNYVNSEIYTKNIFTESVEKSVQTTLNIFGYVIFFAVVMDILISMGITITLSGFLNFLNIPKEIIEGLLCATAEITTGIKKLSESKDFPLSYILVLCSAVIGWGGISVHMQVKGIISKTNLSFKKYLFGKFLHCIISFIVSGFVFDRLTLPLETFADITNNTIKNNNTTSFFIILSVLILLAYISKKLSVKPPYRTGKNCSKYGPQRVNGK